MKKQVRMILYGVFSLLLIVLLFYFFFLSSFFMVDTITVSCSDESTSLPNSLEKKVEGLLSRSYISELIMGSFDEINASPYLAENCTCSFSKGHLQLNFSMEKILANLSEEKSEESIGLYTKNGLFSIHKEDTKFLKNKGLNVFLTEEFSNSQNLYKNTIKLGQLIDTVITINQNSYLISSLKCCNNNINDSFLYTMSLQGCYTKLSFRKDARFADINPAINKVKQMGLINNSKNNTIDVYHDAIVLREGKLGGC